MIIEEVAGGDSLLKRLDPRVKIAVALFFSVVVAVSNRFLVLGSALAVSLGIVLTARIPEREIIRRLLPVNTLILFLWLFLPFTIAGRPLFSFGLLVGTVEGVLYAVRISIKSNAIMLMLIALVASTPIFTLGHAMHELRIPKKLVHLFFFTYRYLHVMHREYVRLVNSMKARGFNPGTNLHTYKTFAYMVGILLVKSFDRAQRVHNAMLCRGFKGNLYSLSELSIKKIDIVSFILMTAVILLFGILEWTKIT